MLRRVLSLMSLRTVVGNMVPFGLFVAFVGFVAGQEVRDAALGAGYLFGSFIPIDESTPEKPAFYAQHISVATVPMYWAFSTHIREGEYTWEDTDESVAVAEANGMEIHGHPLAWGVDDFIPDWVKAKPLSQARGILEDHIETVVTRYRGRVQVYDVVNEVVDNNGQYRQSYWYRAMGINWVTIAFRAANRADPDARLLLNDYSLEVNRLKFEKTKELIQMLISNGVRIDGLGWQAHLFLEEFENPNFSMDSRMAEISVLGLLNYVTEFDVPIPDYSWSTLQRQKVVYKTVAEIFMRNNPPGESVYFQTWDLADRYTWWDDFMPENAPHYPLPFDDNLERKPAYWGMYEAFSGEVNGTPTPIPPEPIFPEPGEYRLQNRWTRKYMHPDGSSDGARVSVQDYTPWRRQKWILEYSRAGSYRLRSKFSDKYLHDNGSRVVMLLNLNPEWTSMEWFLEVASGDSFRLQNRWTGDYLNVAEDQTGVGVWDLNPEWTSMMWSFEGDEPPPPPPPVGIELPLGEARLQNLWTQRYLWANGSGNGAALSVRALSSWKRQRWYVEQGPNGSYRFRSKFSNLYLNDAGPYAVDQYALDEGSDSMTWFAENAGDGRVRLRSGSSSQYLHVQSDQTNVVMQYDLKTEWTSMMWTVQSLGGEEPPPPPDTGGIPLGEVRFENFWTEKYLWADGPGDGATASVMSFLTWKKQRWIMEEGPNGSYRVRSLFSGKYLNDNGAGGINLYALNSIWESQMWYVDVTAGKYQIRNAWTGNLLYVLANQNDVAVLDASGSASPTWGAIRWKISLV